MKSSIRQLLCSATLALAALPVNAQEARPASRIQVVEAEDGVFSGKLDSQHAGFSGAGFVDGKNAVGNSIEIEFGAKSAGKQTLFIRYGHAKPDDRSAELRVNGAMVNPSLAFPATGAFVNWQSVSNSLQVQAGRNVVRLTALNDGGLVNLDRFEITGAPQFKLAVTTGGAGSVKLSPAGADGYFDPGTTVTLTAVPPTNTVFAGWSGAVTGAMHSATVVVDAPKSVSAAFDRLTANLLYVSPSGRDTNPGTKDAPLYSLSEAVAASFPGDVIYMRGGTYAYSATVMIDKAGTSNKPISIVAFPGERPVLDYSSWKPATETLRFNGRGIFLSTKAQWWTLKGLEICNAPDNAIKSEGGHITFDQCIFHHNGDSGLQIGLNKDSLKTNSNPQQFAAYNLVLNCDSYRNADIATKFENADGFACKLYAGKGNRFVGCRAWENADDGWDFYQTSHEIVLDHCWSWHNGDPTFWNLAEFQGDGNGFKLGGADTFCPVKVLNCVALDCQWGTAAGFAYNNNTAPFTLYNCLAVNCGKPYKLRQPGNTLKNCVDVNAVKPAPRDIALPATQENNTWTVGIVATTDDFISLSALDAIAPRQADGSLPDNGFARLKPGSKLIDRGANVGLPFTGSAPDLGPYEEPAQK
jgi:hypothetical protein